MMGSEGSVVQARGAWCSEPSGVRSTGIVTDLTAPVVRAAVARQAIDRPALLRLSRFGGLGRTSVVEFRACHPDAMHDHRQLPGHGHGGALEASTLREGHAPGA